MSMWRRKQAHFFSKSCDVINVSLWAVSKITGFKFLKRAEKSVRSTCLSLFFLLLSSYKTVLAAGFKPLCTRVFDTSFNIEQLHILCTRCIYLAVHILQQNVISHEVLARQWYRCEKRWGSFPKIFTTNSDCFCMQHYRVLCLIEWHCSLLNRNWMFLCIM